MDLNEAIATLQTFNGSDLGETLKRVEASLRGKTIETYANALVSCGAGKEVLIAAGLIKGLVSQINETIHAVGILLCLEQILQPGEEIEYVSLGAGNTGKQFDLETNQRIAEFKFIGWQGGPEAIRQNALFKDFYRMAECTRDKRKILYVLGTEYPLKFFNSRRALSSVLSHHVRLQNEFIEKYGQQYKTVHDYYLPRKETVIIKDLSPFLPELVGNPSQR